MKQKILGECNRCGLCCVNGEGLRCEHLEVIGEIGNPGATFCRVNDTRTHGMPVNLLDKSGRATGRKDTCTNFKQALRDGEKLTLPPTCSLVLVSIFQGAEKQAILDAKLSQPLPKALEK